MLQADLVPETWIVVQGVNVGLDFCETDNIVVAGEQDMSGALLE